MDHKCTTILVSSSTVFTLSGTLQEMSSSNWSTIVAEKRSALSAKIPTAWRLASVPDSTELRNAVDFPRQFLSERAIQITEITDARVLLSKIANGEYTSYEVTEAFCHRAAIAQQVVSVDVQYMPNMTALLTGLHVTGELPDRDHVRRRPSACQGA